MDFCEKLQALRKEKGITQEELADALYVSRTAVSKWESGRGYPNIDSLKDISSFFNVSLDDLLSCEKVISIAENENKKNLRHLAYLAVSLVDIMAFLLILLPLYPNKVDTNIYSVSLFFYYDCSSFKKTVYFILYISLIASGVFGTVLSILKNEKMRRALTLVSFAVSALCIFFLAMSKEPYALSLAFVLLIIKALCIYVCEKNKGRKS